MELFLWKLKIDKFGFKKEQIADRQNCRIKCGASIVIPHVLSFRNKLQRHRRNRSSIDSWRGRMLSKDSSNSSRHHSSFRMAVYLIGIFLFIASIGGFSRDLTADLVSPLRVSRVRYALKEPGHHEQDAISPFIIYQQ
eukprot:scaffold7572_cov118-Cylindrotheca_fusiformis.AAC.9